jgi:ribonuclease BN (tRNA processing enzyme)
VKKPDIIPLGADKKLEITNSGKLSFFWPGTGSAFSKKLFQTNPVIIKGNDHVLIDCGTRCPFALWTYGGSITKIKNVVVTHSHADHVGGLEELALMGRYFVKEKPNMIITEEYEKFLWEYSLKGGCGFNERHDGKYLEFDDLFKAVRPKGLCDRPREIYEAQCGSINMKLFRTKHYPDSSRSWFDSCLSYGVVFDDKVVYTADTRFDADLFDDLMSKIPTIECYFHDVQLFTGGVHAGYQELNALPAEIKEKIFLVHYGDNFEEFDPVKDGFAGFVKQGHFYDF